MLVWVPWTVAGVVPEARRASTELTLRSFPRFGLEVELDACRKGWEDYASHFEQHWNGRRPFVLLEQDCDPPAMFVRQLAECPEAICVAPFEGHRTFGAGGRPADMGYSCSYDACDPDPMVWTHGGASIVPGGEPFLPSGMSGFGLIKFRPELVHANEPFRLVEGKGAIDSRFWTTLRRDGIRYKLHVHWLSGNRMVTHHHPRCLGDGDV